MTTCIRPNQKNILRFLELQGPQGIVEICFSLDITHGCVWTPSQVLPMLKALQAKDLISKRSDTWALHIEGDKTIVQGPGWEGKVDVNLT